VVSKLKKFLLIYSEIFFADNELLGMIVVFSTFIDPNTGLCGVIAIGSAYFFSRLTFARGLGFEPFFYYNPLLVGLSIGVLFKLSPLTVVLVFLSAIFTFILTVGLNFLVRKYTGLPILSIPFVIVSSFIYLSTLRSSGLFSNYLQYHSPVVWDALPVWINGYFLSLGSIFFSTNILVGIIIAVGLLMHSRIMFFLSIIGYYTGAILTGEFNSTAATTFLNLNYFNYILIAIAIGSIYLIPSFKSYLIAVVAVGMSYIILGAVEVFFSAYGIPVFTLPFNIVVLALIYYSDIINSRLRTYTYLKNPEANLDFYINYIKRFGLECPAISLPFSGFWKISQGFDDTITHKGPWKHGVDFIVVDEAGNQSQGPTSKLSSYYAFNKPVLSPVSGTVVAVKNTMDDNDPGSVNRQDNWGNHVVIYDHRGFYVKICHLKKDSVVPGKGMTVETGEMIGRCGNSGYSPFPHIHLQVQGAAADAAPTMEFVFEQVLDRDNLYHNHLSPVKDQILSALHSSIKKQKKMELLLGDTFEFVMKINEDEQQETVTVELDLDGTSCLKNGPAKLYFETYKNMFRFYKYTGPKTSILRYLYLAMPSLPLCSDSIEWKDDLPLDISLETVIKNGVLLMQSLYPAAAGNAITLRYLSDLSFSSRNTMNFFHRNIITTSSEVQLHRNKFVDTVSIVHGHDQITITRK